MFALTIAEYTAVFVFGLSGAMVASRAQLDVVGFLFLACLTGVGGGTFRDLVLGQTSVFWVQAPSNLFAASAAGLLGFLIAPMIESRYKWLMWSDAAALSVAVPLGVFVALQATASWPIALLMGVATGTFGGLMRDVIANEIPLVLVKGEMHISAAFGGACTVPLVLWLSGSEALAFAIAALGTFTLRWGSITLGWRIPNHKTREPKHKPPAGR